MHKGNIKNIIFDLGAVIINIDTERTANAMKELGFNDPASPAGGFEQSYTLFKQLDLFDQLEKGLIGPDYFRNELRKHIKDKVEDYKLDVAWGAMLLDFPQERIELIKELKKRYNVYLLSNTNEIHYKQYSNDFLNQYGFEFDNLFVKAYYSFQMGTRKPEFDIFKKVISENKMNPRETLFIDDLQINIESAKKAGLQTMWIDISKNEDIVEKLNGF